MIRAILKSVDYLIVALFLIVVYAQTGVFFFRGATENRCRITLKPINSSYWPINNTIENLCGEFECPSELYLNYVLFYL